MRYNVLRTDGIILLPVAGLFLFAAAARGGTITFTGQPEGSLAGFHEAGFVVGPSGFEEYSPSILPEGNPAPAVGNYESGVYTGTRIRDNCGGLFRFDRADYASPTYPQSVVHVEGYLGSTLAYQQTFTGSGGTWHSTSSALITELRIIVEKGDGSTVWVDNIVLTIVDCNGNDVSDACELAEHDCNFNGVPDDCELAGHDCNQNGTLDSCDIDSGVSGDCNANRIPDSCEPDCNNTGIPDPCDVADGTSADCNGNHIPDECEPDCNENGVADECDFIVPARSSYSLSPHIQIPDSNSTGVSSTIIVPDGGVITDVNVGLYIYHPIQGDVVVTLSHGSVTRRLINRPGLCHDPLRGYLASSFGSSNNLLALDDSAPTFTHIDCYVGNLENGIAGYVGPARPSQSLSVCGPDPDQCPLDTGVDFKGLDPGGLWTLTVIDSPNGFAGLSGFFETWRLDVESLSVDCNANGIPDECEPDCNANGIADGCDIAAGTSDDCNANAIPDECDLAVGTSENCNHNGVPDECEPDCNINGTPDECDLTVGASEDCNANGTPDECDITAPSSHILSPNVAIPDRDAVGIQSVITVPEGIGAIRDVDVALYIDHPVQGDLVVTLSHDGITRTLIHRAGLCLFAIGYTAPDFGTDASPLVLDDAAPTSIDCYAGTTTNGIPGYTGPARPNQSLAAFNGRNPGGAWTLSVVDSPINSTDLVGTLVSWGIELKGGSADCNISAIPDECEHDLGGDSDDDQIIDLSDHAFLVDCLAGPGAEPGYAECFDLCLAAFDMDHDGDVDLRDASAFNLLLAT